MEDEDSGWKTRRSASCTRGEPTAARSGPRGSRPGGGRAPRRSSSLGAVSRGRGGRRTPTVGPGSRRASSRSRTRTAPCLRAAHAGEGRGCRPRGVRRSPFGCSYSGSDGIAGASVRVPSFRASRKARPRSSVSRLMVEFATPTMRFPPTKRTLFFRSAMYSRTRFGVTSMRAAEAEEVAHRFHVVSRLAQPLDVRAARSPDREPREAPSRSRAPDGAPESVPRRRGGFRPRGVAPSGTVGPSSRRRFRRSPGSLRSGRRRDPSTRCARSRDSRPSFPFRRKIRPSPRMAPSFLEFVVFSVRSCFMAMYYRDVVSLFKAVLRIQRRSFDSEKRRRRPGSRTGESSAEWS